MAINTRSYIERYEMIRNKLGKIVPLVLNDPQEKLYNALAEQYRAGKPMRAIVLKARQEGISTLTEGMIFKRAATMANHKAVIVAHTEASTKSLFEMSKLFYDELPSDIKPDTRSSNAYEIAFDKKDGEGLRSTIVCYTAGGRGIGRGDTIHSLHVSEYAFWPDNKKEIFGGLIQAVPNDPDTMVVIESTARGFDDFKDKWDRAVAGESDFIAVFFAWFELAEYRSELPADFELLAGGRYGNEIQIKHTFDLDDEQMAWRRWCIDNNCDGDLDLFRQEYPATPEEAFIATGLSVFPTDTVIQQLARIRTLDPIAKGYFDYSKKYLSPDVAEITNIKWIDDTRGMIWLYEKPKKQYDGETVIAECPYVLGGDTAGMGDDYFTGYVINNSTKETAAVVQKQQWNDDLYADQMYCLGLHYNTALIGIETNFSLTAMRELEKLRYPRLYLRDRFDTLTSKYTKALGFETTKVSKPIIIDNLVKLVRDMPQLFKDARTLREMLTFIRDPKTGKMGASEGKHDDLVIAAAIAYIISSQITSVWEQVKQEPMEDYIKKNFKVKPKDEGGILEW